MAGRIRHFLTELKRRKVYRVAVVYAAVAFIVWQAAEIAVPGLRLPDVVLTLVIVISFLGFPIAVVLAWAYEVTPAGVRPETPVQPTETAPTPTVDRSGPPARAGAAAGVNSVAVLPFDNLSPEPDSEYFADGITEEITHSLARVEGLQVVARTSAFALKGHTDIREVGERLGASHVIEGSVRRAGDQLRVTAQLIDSASGYHMWSQRYDRKLDDVFAVQDEIAAGVASLLTTELAAETAPPKLPRTHSLEAYDHYLQGRYYRNSFDAGSAEKSVAFYEHALEQDPDYAPAYAGMAEAHIIRAIGFAWEPTRDALAKAREAADRALDLDSTLAEAHVTRALVHMYDEWDYPAARRGLERAVQLNPNSSIAFMWLEFYWTYVEHRYEESVSANRRARELDPLDMALPARLGTLETLYGNLEHAVEIHRELIERDPRNGLPYLGLADALGRKGDLEECIRAAETAVELTGGPVAAMSMLGMYTGMAGQESRAREILHNLQGRVGEGYVSGFWLAAVHAGLRESDAAFTAFDRALQEHDANLLYAYFLPRSLGLHGDPRFRAVLERIRLAHLLSDTGSVSERET